MGAPAGNQNARKRTKMLTDALRRELTQNPEDALAVTRKLIECAKNGDSWAQILIHERVDGKVPQAIVGDDEEAPIRTVNRIELVDLNDSGTDPAPSEA